MSRVVQLAKQNQVEFIWPFKSTYFSADADCDKVKRGASNGEILRAPEADSAKNILAGTFSVTGRAYRKLGASQ